MRYLKPILLCSLTALITPLYAASADLTNLAGDWHLRVMDGYDVRKVRAILDFDPKQMRIGGFDACNRISGKLTSIGEHRYKTTLRSTRMACRGQSFTFVSRRLHEALESGFTIKEEKRYGIEGITIKSERHDLFFKRMGKK